MAIGKYLHINFRNHRKILVVDGLKAFVGGLNLGEEYLGKDSDYLLKFDKPKVSKDMLHLPSYDF